MMIMIIEFDAFQPNHSMILQFCDLDIFLLSQLAEIKLHVQELLEKVAWYGLSEGQHMDNLGA